MENNHLALARTLARAVEKNGGRAFFVGGYVRDRMLSRENKDIDIEVHGLEYGDLLALLQQIGTPIITGVSFGVFGLKGTDMDIAMPRKEKATGRGHKDFEIFVDPWIGPRAAACRRDFTVNAMMEDVLTGEVLDFFGGQEDLKHGVLRHVSDASFREDPLRVLRAAQFAARFGFRVAPETVELCRTMDLTALSRERVMEELKKALLKADRPSVFFRVLDEMQALSFWFPEVEQLQGIPQEPAFHPEGDVWVHTLQVLDAAASLREQARSPLYFMLAALCHDLGKVVSTTCENGVIHSYWHDESGAPLVRSLIQRLTAEHDLLRYVENMTLLHMRPNLMLAQHASEKAFMRLYDQSVCPEDLILLSKADALGSCCPADLYAPRETELRQLFQCYRELMDRPYVTGSDLIAAGVQPGPAFKEALAYAHKTRLAGLSKEDSLRQTLGVIHAGPPKPEKKA